MITAILILTIFNTGLIFIIGVGGIGVLKDCITKSEKNVIKRVDYDTEQAVTAIYNMDSLKQKAEMSGHAEIN